MRRQIKINYEEGVVNIYDVTSDGGDAVFDSFVHMMGEDWIGDSYHEDVMTIEYGMDISDKAADIKHWAEEYEVEIIEK